jgi:hypothetical protein
VLSLALVFGLIKVLELLHVGVNVWTVGGLIVLWVIGLELDLLPWLLERALLRSRWLSFDAHADDAADRARTREAIKDNPSLS